MSVLFGDKQLLRKSSLDNANGTPGFDKEDNFHSVRADEVLEGKVVCLFFSALWCTPCQHFIPLLRDMYTELSKRKEAIEIVFLSFDKTEAEMLDYYKRGHGDWLALPFGDSFKETLVEKYSISVIPKLIVIQPNGTVITCKGRKDVQDKGIVCLRTWHSALQKPPVENKEDQNNQELIITN